MKTFRALVAFNTLLVFLSFIPAFSGFEDTPGFADHLFPNRSGGFRGDITWLMLSGAALVLWSVFASFRWLDERDRSHRVDAVVGVVWVLEYAIYLRFLLHHLYMG